MEVPLPCKFGENSYCENMILPLKGVSWFKWQTGMEYTYFFQTGKFWNGTKFYTTYRPEINAIFKIPDNLLLNGFVKEKGYPLRGKGYASGIDYVGGKTYIDFIMTDMYLAHIRVQCDSEGNYIPGGSVIFPPSWDTDEKKEKAIIKSYKATPVIPNRKTEPQKEEYKQMTIFDALK